MASSAADDLSPAEFVKKIRELNDKRDREDAERFAALEQKIERDKIERAARRAERARSLSPEKSGTSPQPALRDRNSPSPSPQPSNRDSMTENNQSQTSLARSGTLSWQQRPKSSGGRRPLSMIAAENAARSPRATPDIQSEDAPEPSRAKIAESLGSKDPAWFRQTADRGVGSAAYRRSQEEPHDPGNGLTRRGLPGMSKDSTPPAQSSPPTQAEEPRSTSPSRANSVRSTTSWSDKLLTTSVGSDGAKSPFNGPKLTPSTDPTPGGRSPSPTKGMGGFVQSAMMKRSDSVNKRWSAQAGTGISRQNSTASNRSGYGGSSSMPRLDAKAPLTENDDGTDQAAGFASSAHGKDDQADTVDSDGFAKPSVPRIHSRSKSIASLRNSVQLEKEESSQPSSPTKRWSPTKSSWLESALHKEEKPKPKPLPPLTQPPWMTEINKAKQQKTSSSVDDADSSEAKEPTESRTEPKKSPPAEASQNLSQLSKVSSAPASIEIKEAPSPRQSPKPGPKPTIGDAKATDRGKFDFRANLKSRTLPSDGSKSEEPEFKNALSKLRRAETKNYVAPDTFKANITRGKAALAVTGGPAKRERVDELKESILKKKQVMQQKVEAEGPTKQEKHVESSSAEALTRQKAISRAEGFEDPLSKKKAAEATVPEFLARQKSMQEKTKPTVPSKPTSPPSKETTRTSLSQPLNRSQPADSVDFSKSGDSATKAGQPRRAESSAKANVFSAGLKAGASSKLADRFNPGLAGMLARGPSPAGINREGASEPTFPSASNVSNTDSSKSSKELSHMTKSRAKGPKRRAPKATAEEQKKEEPTTAEERPHAQSPTTDGPQMAAKGHVISSSLKAGPRSPSTTLSPLQSVPLVKQKDILPSSPPQNKLKETTPNKPKPAAPLKSPLLSQKDKRSTEEPEKDDFVPSTLPQTSSMPKEEQPLQQKKPKEVMPPDTSFGGRPLSMKGAQAASNPVPEESASKRVSEISDFSVKSASSLWSKQTQSTPVEPSPVSRPSSITSVKQISNVEYKSHAPKATSNASQSAPSKTWDSLGKHFQAPDSPNTTRPESPVKSRSPERVDDDLSNVSVKNAAALWGRQEQTVSNPGRLKPQVKLPTQRDEEKAMRDAGLMPQPEMPKKDDMGVGLGLSGTSTTSSITRLPLSPPLSPPLTAGLQTQGTNSAVDIEEPGFPTSSTVTAYREPVEFTKSSDASDPTRPKTPEKQKSRPPSSAFRAPPESPIPQTSEANRLFGDFFDERPVATPVGEIDTLALLEADPLRTEQSKTIRTDMLQLDEDGKPIPVPRHQQHILVDDMVYICTHVFEVKEKKRAEVFVWVGSNSVAATFEDAYSLAKRIAKDNGATLITLHQGRETSSFIQAIGGIIVTFRGSHSSTFTIPDNFMLCGRRHLGHIAFDEVDFSLNSFCSGFPYIISHRSKLYLWKGIGCNAGELGCARLIAMSLGMTPDMIEVAEGHEPPSFLNIFPQLISSPSLSGGSIPRSADHWRLKPGCDNYRCRLFRVRQDEPRSPAKERSSLQVTSFFGGVFTSAASHVVTRKRSWSTIVPQPTADSPTREQAPPVTPTSSQLKSPGILGFASRRGSSLAAPPSPIEEIAPFTQRDLVPEGIFVLDAFFEIYVLIGTLAQSQARAFSTALIFAQDYGILAASMEDRPFVPVSTVVLEGAPRDMKAVFRQWSDELMLPPTQALMNGKPRRAGSLRCVGLSAALAATGRHSNNVV